MGIRYPGITWITTTSLMSHTIICAQYHLREYETKQNSGYK